MYVVYAALGAVAAVLFFVGFGIVYNNSTYDEQVPGINTAIVGAVLVNVAGVLLLLAGHRAVAARRVAVLGFAPAIQEGPEAVSTPASATALVGGDGLTHFHRADCAMAAGREWPALERAAHERAGRITCGVCKP